MKMLKKLLPLLLTPALAAGSAAPVLAHAADGAVPDDTGVIKGDVDLSGVVDRADLIVLKRWLEGDPNVRLAELGLDAADFNSDGNIDDADIEALAALLSADPADYMPNVTTAADEPIETTPYPDESTIYYNTATLPYFTTENAYHATVPYPAIDTTPYTDESTIYYNTATLPYFTTEDAYHATVPYPTIDTTPYTDESTIYYNTATLPYFTTEDAYHATVPYPAIDTTPYTDESTIYYNTATLPYFTTEDAYHGTVPYPAIDTTPYTDESTIYYNTATLPYFTTEYQPDETALGTTVLYQFGQKGDVDLSGVVDRADLIVLKRYLEGDPNVRLAELGLDAADFNSDGSIDDADIEALAVLLGADPADYLPEATTAADEPIETTPYPDESTIYYNTATLPYFTTEYAPEETTCCTTVYTDAESQPAGSEPTETDTAASSRKIKWGLPHETMFVGEQARLNVFRTGDSEITCKAEDESVLQVGEPIRYDGFYVVPVTALQCGETRLTAFSSDGQEAVCVITVTGETTDITTAATCESGTTITASTEENAELPQTGTAGRHLFRMTAAFGMLAAGCAAVYASGMLRKKEQ